MIAKIFLVALTAGAFLLSSAAPAASAEDARTTMALEFADGLGSGQRVANAEDGVPMRSVENLQILAEEFRLGYGGAPLPVTVTGISDSNGNDIDDDGQVTVKLFGSDACLILGARTYRTAPGACGATATSTSLASRSARGLDAARRWRVASENAWADQSNSARISAWNVDALRASLGEVRAGVRLSGLTDRNGNQVDDDGKLQFTSSAGSVCLHLTKSTRTAGTITAGAC